MANATKIQIRPVLSEREWLEKHGSELVGIDHSLAIAVLRIVAQCLKVNPTQLHPSDNLFSDYDFACNTWWKCLIGNSAWERFTTDLADYVVRSRGRELSNEEAMYVYSWNTLSDAIHACATLIDS